MKNLIAPLVFLLLCSTALSAGLAGEPPLGDFQLLETLNCGGNPVDIYLAKAEMVSAAASYYATDTDTTSGKVTYLVGLYFDPIGKIRTVVRGSKPSTTEQWLGASVPSGSVQADPSGEASFSKIPVLKSDTRRGDFALAAQSDDWFTSVGIVSVIASFSKVGALLATASPGEYLAPHLDWSQAAWSFSCPVAPLPRR